MRIYSTIFNVHVLVIIHTFLIDDLLLIAIKLRQLQSKSLGCCKTKSILDKF